MAKKPTPRNNGWASIGVLLERQGYTEAEKLYKSNILPTSSTPPSREKLNDLMKRLESKDIPADICILSTEAVPDSIAARLNLAYAVYLRDTQN